MKNKLPLGGDSLFWYFIGFLGILFIYSLGALLDIMEVDATQYASISRDMMLSGEYLQIKERAKDYLDKPPLLFWFSALAFYLFGVSNFVYRIFPILSSLLGAYAVFRFAKLYYNAPTGRLAALVLLSCQAYFLINHDIRTDTMLANAVMFAIWQIAEYNEKGKWKYLIFGFIGIAVAVLAKGPLGLMVPVLAFSTDFILKRKWLSFFKWQWLVGLCIVALVIFPFCWGLYQQFDLHPEKTINNRTGTSGVYFFLWSHSFGRLTGEDDFIRYVHAPQNDNDPFFFVHTFAWSFLPWTIFYFIGFWKDLLKLIRNRLYISSQEEAIALGGFLLTVLAISFSKYKMPNHIYVALPLATVTAAKVLYEVLYSEKHSGLFKFSYGWQLFAIISLWVLGILLVYSCFPMTNFWYWLLIGFLFILVIYWAFWGKNRFQKLILPSLFTIIGVNFLLNAQVYPALMQYQSSVIAAKYARYELKISPKKLYTFDLSDDNSFGLYESRGLDFYSQNYIGGTAKPMEKLMQIAQSGKCWVYTNQEGLDKLQTLGQNLKMLKKLDYFHITALSLEFLNPNTRPKEIKPMYLLEFTLKK